MRQALCGAIACCEMNASEPSPGGDFPEQIGLHRSLARQLGIELAS
jgi:hypothetical protein